MSHARPSRRSGSAVLAATLTLAAFSAVVAGAGRADAATGSGTEPVIVLLRDQHAALPADKSHADARRAATESDQAALVSDARAHGASKIRQLHVLNAFAATASPAEVARLNADPKVAAVYPDRLVAAPRTARETPEVSTRGPVSSQTCPANPARPLLEPEALQLTNTAFLDPQQPSAQQIATGAGVKVAFVADGIDVHNPDFVRADGTPVFSDYQDFSGDGPLAPTSAAEAFGDASSIAAQGRVVYDLANFVNPAHPLPAGCTIRVQGVSPGASLVGLKVFPTGGFAFNSAILAALDYAATVDKVDVVNESLGANQYPDTGDDPLVVFNRALVASGITVTASSGDAGGENTIGSPATDPAVISVAATTAFRTYAQTVEAGFQLGRGSYASNNISGLSSSGVTQGGRTVDLAAPGDLGWAVCTPDPDVWQDCADDKGAPSQLLEFGGTSQSSPFTAGAAADVIQAYRETHGGRTPAPALVKRLLTGSATDLGFPSTEQGAGLLNVLAAVRAARSSGDSSVNPSGSSLLTSPTQLDLTTASGRATSSDITVTNVGAAARTVTPSLRSEDHVVATDQFSVTLSPLTDPQFVDSFGLARAYRAQKFTVPAGVDRLSAAIAWAAPTPIVRVVLVDPHGTFQAFSQPQGAGSYGLADVRNPEAGTWTAYLWTRAASNGFAGAVDLTTTAYRRVTVGSVSPASQQLAPGATGTFHVTVPAGDAGDVADAVEFDGSAAVVPVVIRNLISTGPRGGSFSGTFGGGNGRAGIPSPSRTYEFDVPTGQPELTASLTIDGGPAQALYGFLVDPNGEPVSVKTNQTVATDGSKTFADTLQFTHRQPQAGRWQLTFAGFGPIPGTSTVTGYRGSVGYAAPTVSATGLPTSAKTVLPAGQKTSITLQFVNTGAAADRYFVDARAAGARQDLTLAGTDTTLTLGSKPLPPFPAFGVPTETTSLTVSGTSSKRPIGFEVGPFPADHVTDLSFEGDPDRIAGPFGLAPSVTVSDPIVAPLTWLALPTQIGPFAGQTPNTKVSFAATALTAPFDLAVRSSTGDPELLKVQRGPAASPLLVPAGTVGSVRVSITPTGKAGDVVRGVLYLDTIDPVTGSSDEVAAVPYAYTVG